jgi:hypothetical protein
MSPAAPLSRPGFSGRDGRASGWKCSTGAASDCIRRAER